MIWVRSLPPGYPPLPAALDDFSPGVFVKETRSSVFYSRFRSLPRYYSLESGEYVDKGVGEPVVIPLSLALDYLILHSWVEVAWRGEITRRSTDENRSR